jgi:hypothetical protein
MLLPDGDALVKKVLCHKTTTFGQFYEKYSSAALSGATPLAARKHDR